MKKLVAAILFIFIVVTVFYLTIFGPRGFMHLKGLQQELDALNLQNSRLQQENTALRKEIQLLKDNLDYVEEIARSELGLVKDDELVYHLKKKNSQN